jgi:medium-chain acyl-[acyl-carrier-protein] hydrolase
MQNSYLINFTSKPNAKLNLFCFPYAGGGASIFRKFKALLPDEIELIGVQYPGRENLYREPAIKDMKLLVNTLTEVIQPLLNKPSVFFGYSLGGIVAYEVSIQLQDPQLKHLLIAASRPPEEIAADESLKKAAASPEAAINKMRFFDGTPEAILNDPELLNFFGRILQNDFSLFATYSILPHAKLNCPITVLYGDDEQENSMEQASKWKKYTDGSFKVCAIPGNHFFINESADEIVEIIQEVSSIA